MCTYKYKQLISVFIVAFVLSASLSHSIAETEIENPAELFYKSLDLHKQGKYKEAVEMMSRLNTIDPNNPNVVANLAQFSADAGDYLKAVENFKKLITLEPDNKEARRSIEYFQAMAFAQQNDYKKAVEQFKAVLKNEPDNSVFIWNAASVFVKAGEHAAALDLWKNLREKEPQNMLLQSKIIQANQALDNKKERDKEIEKIQSMYKQNVDPNYSRQKRFCREQYALDENHVFVFQLFESGDENKYFYRYTVTNPEGFEIFWLSLGSYQSTTEFARSTGSIGPEERMYHLDYYDKKMHATVGMYNSKPSYDELRNVSRDYIRSRLADSK